MIALNLDAPKKAQPPVQAVLAEPAAGWKGDDGKGNKGKGEDDTSKGEGGKDDNGKGMRTEFTAPLRNGGKDGKDNKGKGGKGGKDDTDNDDARWHTGTEAPNWAVQAGYRRHWRCKPGGKDKILRYCSECWDVDCHRRMLMWKLPGVAPPRIPAVQTPMAGTAFEVLDEAVEQPAEFRPSREYWICCDCWVLQDIDERNENTYMLMVSAKKSQCKINGNIAFNASMDKEWKDLRVVLGKCTITITESQMGTIDGNIGDENLVAANWAAKQLTIRAAQRSAKAGQAQPSAASSDGKKVDRRIMDLTDAEFATLSERDLNK